MAGILSRPQCVKPVMFFTDMPHQTDFASWHVTCEHTWNAGVLVSSLASSRLSSSAFFKMASCSRIKLACRLSRSSWKKNHYRQTSSISHQIPNLYGSSLVLRLSLPMVLVSSCGCLCPIHWSQMLSRAWRCSWSSADRRCSNYIWVINNYIA